MVYPFHSRISRVPGVSSIRGRAGAALGPSLANLSSSRLTITGSPRCLRSCRRWASRGRSIEAGSIGGSPSPITFQRSLSCDADMPGNAPRSLSSLELGFARWCCGCGNVVMGGSLGLKQRRAASTTLSPVQHRASGLRLRLAAAIQFKQQCSVGERSRMESGGTRNVGFAPPSRRLNRLLHVSESCHLFGCEVTAGLRINWEPRMLALARFNPRTKPAPHLGAATSWMAKAHRVPASARRPSIRPFSNRSAAGHHSVGAEKSRPILVNSTPSFWIRFNAYSYRNWPTNLASTGSTCILFPLPER